MYKSVSLPGGTVLPFALERMTRCDYVPVEAALDQQAARLWLEGRMRERLEGQIDGRIVSEKYSAVVERGVLTVTLRAVCLENIAVTCPVGQAAEGRE